MNFNPWPQCFLSVARSSETFVMVFCVQPALSVGNAGQLAVDLLICRTAIKAGYLEEPHVLPCVGNDPFGPSADGDLAVALEGTF